MEKSGGGGGGGGGGSWGWGGVFRRWRTGRASALSPSLILDAVYSLPLSFPVRELIASVHVSHFSPVAELPLDNFISL